MISVCAAGFCHGVETYVLVLRSNVWSEHVLAPPLCCAPMFSLHGSQDVLGLDLALI